MRHAKTSSLHAGDMLASRSCTFTPHKSSQSRSRRRDEQKHFYLAENRTTYHSMIALSQLTERNDRIIFRQPCQIKMLLYKIFLLRLIF
jgi:hypothetical protein